MQNNTCEYYITKEGQNHYKLLVLPQELLEPGRASLKDFMKFRLEKSGRNDIAF